MMTLTRGEDMASVFPAIVRAHPVAVLAALDRTPPALTRQVPLDRRCQPGGKLVARPEAELPRDLSRVDCLSAGGGGPVLHERDQIARLRHRARKACAQRRIRRKPRGDHIAEHADEIEIRDFVLAAD